MIKRTGTFLIVFAAIALRGQNISLALTERAEDGQYAKLVMSIPVFEFRKDSVANPLDISAATPEDKVVWQKAVLPAMDKKYRAGFAWIFNGAAPSGFAASHTLIGIQNPGWTFYPTYIWTDRNNDLDLTNDGPPDTLTAQKGTILRIGSTPTGYQAFVQHFPVDQFPLYASLNDAEMNKVKGNRRFFGTGSSLREKRRNVLAGRWKNGRDSFALAVKDVNCNGVYNDAGVDMVMITDYHGQFDNLQGVLQGKDGAVYLEWNNCAYHVKRISKDGSFVEIQRDSTATMQFSLNVGRKIPKFKYCTATKPQKHKSIRKLKGDYVFVYVWRDGAPDFIRDSAELHKLGRMNNPHFKVLALNYDASGKYVLRYNKLYNTAIQQGFSSNNINNRLKIKKIPTGILMDRKQRIVAVGITPEQAEKILRDLSILQD